MRASFFSIGCKLNSYENESLQRQFLAAGWTVVPFGEQAEVTVLNTCTVTDRSDADCRKLIRRAKRNYPGTSIVVTGCLAERIPERLAAMPETSLILGNHAKHDLFRLTSLMIQGELAGKTVQGCSVTARQFLSVAPIRARSNGMRTRATLQVQDGCDEHCTYCIIPSVRGSSRSRPIADIEGETRALLDAGYLEIALTGVNTGAWGKDIGEDGGILSVVDAILGVTGSEGGAIRRLRLNSLEPRAITRELAQHVEADPRLCRHFHVPLQSGSDTILKCMGRRYRSAEYAATIYEIAETVPNAAIGADVMVGFPGETDALFEETIALISALPLTYLHVFSYSPREGTPATRFGDTVPHNEKDNRSHQLRLLSEAKRLEFHQRHVGETLDVLLEGSTKTAGGTVSGLSDNYIRVSLPVLERGDNLIVRTRLTRADAEGAAGVVVGAPGDPEGACRS